MTSWPPSASSFPNDPAATVTTYEPVEVVTSNSDIAHLAVPEIDRDGLSGDPGVGVGAKERHRVRDVIEGREPLEAGLRSEALDLVRRSASDRVIVVSVTLGNTALINMPRSAKSAAAECTKPAIAAFETV